MAATKQVVFAQSKLYVCATAQTDDLDQTAFEVLDWTEIKGIVSIPETGKTTNILERNLIDTDVAQGVKGTTTSWTGDIEVVPNASDAGQIVLNAASELGNSNTYAFKLVLPDAPIGGTGTTKYCRCLVTGPQTSGGENEDFVSNTYSVRGNQAEVLVAASSAGGVAPYFTVAPAISGTEEVGSTLTCDGGTALGDATIVKTFQWLRNNVVISGATASTYVLVSADTGKYISCRVRATNDSGSVFATSEVSGIIVMGS